jgi:hypothetical protein
MAAGLAFSGPRRCDLRPVLKITKLNRIDPADCFAHILARALHPSGEARC